MLYYVNAILFDKVQSTQQFTKFFIIYNYYRLSMHHISIFYLCFHTFEFLINFNISIKCVSWFFNIFLPLRKWNIFVRWIYISAFTNINKCLYILNHKVIIVLKIRLTLITFTNIFTFHLTFRNATFFFSTTAGF